ncbi:hypothetical protein GTY89_27470, partial [Streptomyces sp. SID5471]|nr:hypothetical protein [Streptomyces sp. SID5471]
QSGGTQSGGQSGSQTGGSQTGGSQTGGSQSGGHSGGQTGGSGDSGGSGSTGGSGSGGSTGGSDDGTGTGTDNEGTAPIEQPGEGNEQIVNTPGQPKQQAKGGELAETGASGTTFLLVGAATMIAGGIGFRLMPRLINKGGGAAAA